MIQHMSVNDMSLLISLLSPSNRYIINQIIETKPSTGDIVDFKRSEPFNIVQFVEQTTILKTMGYHLLEPIHISLVECNCCRNKACATLEYCNIKDINDSHSFELCLHCFHAVKETPVYASAEGDQ